MGVVRTIRVTMPDRPGALAAVTTALAAHRVDVVRIDVVSHDGDVVVDDLVLRAARAEDIGEAIGGFWPEVAVRTFETPAGDPALEMGRAIAAVTGAQGGVEARRKLARAVTAVLRAEGGVVLRALETGAIVPVAGLPATAVVGPSEGFAGRWVLAHRCAAAFPAAEGWAPAEFAAHARAAWVAMAPLGGDEVVAALRQANIPYCRGELERLETLARAVAPVLGSAGAVPEAAIAAVDGLPPRAVTVGTG